MDSTFQAKDTEISASQMHPSGVPRPQCCVAPKSSTPPYLGNSYAVTNRGACMKRTEAFTALPRGISTLPARHLNMNTISRTAFAPSILEARDSTNELAWNQTSSEATRRQIQRPRNAVHIDTSHKSCSRRIDRLGHWQEKDSASLRKLKTQDCWGNLPPVSHYA